MDNEEKTIVPDKKVKGRFDNLPSVVQDIYAPPPKPVYDETLPENIKRAAKATALAKGFSALGNAFSLGVGGNVEKPKQDRETPAYLNSYIRLNENRNRQTNDWNYKVWANNMRNALHKEQMQYRKDRDAVMDDRYDENVKRQNDRYKDTKEYRDKAFDLRKKTIEEQSEYRDKNFELQKERLEVFKNRPYVNAEIARQQREEAFEREMETYKTKAKYDKDSIILYNDKGKAVTQLQKNQLERLVNIILKDKATAKLAEKNIDIMKATFGNGLTKQHMENIVAYYYDKSPDAMKFLGLQPNSSSVSNDASTSKDTSKGKVFGGFFNY